MGQILDRLGREGLAENTAVFLFTDHGISHLRDKQFLYEGGVKIPFIVRWPGQVKPATRRRDLISHLDIAATSLGMAGIALPANGQGRDFFLPRITCPEPRFSAPATAPTRRWT